MARSSSSALSFTRHDAEVLGRALHRSEGFEGRSVVNERLLREVERVRAGENTGSARPNAGGRRRSKRPTSSTRQPRTAEAANAGSRSASKTPSRASKGASSAPAASGAATSLRDRLLAAASGAVDWLFNLHGAPKAALCVLAAVAVLFLFFYQPSADLWAAHRDHDRLLAEQASLAQMSGEIEERIAALRSEEGIMDEARVRGYAPAGEIAADAGKLVGEDDEDEAIIPVLSQAPEETEDSPLTQALDAFFGYQKRAA